MGDGRSRCFATLPNGLQTALHIAAGAGAVEAVGELLKHGANVHAVTSNQAQPLHFAAQKGAWAVIDILLGAGADVAALDAHGASCFHLVAAAGHATALERLLKVPAAVAQSLWAKADASGITPLHAATKFGRVEVVRKLLAAGATTDALAATLDARDNAGRTCLHTAAQGGTSPSPPLLPPRPPPPHGGFLRLCAWIQNRRTHLRSCFFTFPSSPPSPPRPHPTGPLFPPTRPLFHFS